MKKLPFRVLLLTNTFAPYRAPVWEALAEHVDHLQVIVLAEKKKNRIWDIPDRSNRSYRVLGSKAIFVPKLEDYIYYSGKIIQAIREVNPTHIILAGYQHIPFIKAMIYSKIKKIPLLYWYESHSLSSVFSKGLIQEIKKMLLRQGDAWVASGQMTRNFLLEIGIPDSKIIVAPNVVDVSIFSAKISHASGNKIKILYAGRYLPHKGIALLLDAYKKISSPDVMLRFVGHGPLEKLISEQAEKQNNIEVSPPATSPNEMAEHYAWADILVFPTFRDPWGLVLNEALASGCYVLASELAGATNDLVKLAPSDVGKTFDPNDGPDQLTDLIQHTIQRIDIIRQKRQIIQEWGETFTPEFWAKQMISGLSISSKEIEQ